VKQYNNNILLYPEELLKTGVLLISHGNFEKSFLEKLGREIEKEFHLKVYSEESRIDLNEFFDPMRRQYDANKIMKALAAEDQTNSIKRIGLFRVDLFIPILTFIFGQAALNGNTGIASLYRLRNEQYGIKKDDNILFERFKKVIIHELGHTFGLIHCHFPTCVMRSSTYVEDIDQKSYHFCDNCKRKINR
jgi:archaemetzincin